MKFIALFWKYLIMKHAAWKSFIECTNYICNFIINLPGIVFDLGNFRSNLTLVEGRCTQKKKVRTCLNIARHLFKKPPRSPFSCYQWRCAVKTSRKKLSIMKSSNGFLYKRDLEFSYLKFYWFWWKLAKIPCKTFLF